MSATVSKNIFWLTLSRLVALFLLFLAYRLLFRYLGPFGTGQYQFVLSYVLIYTAIVDFGIQQYITKKISESPAEKKVLFQKFLSFESLVAFVIFAVLVSIAYFRNFDTVVFQAVVVTGLGLVVNALTYPFLAVMTAFQDLKKVALINFLNSLINVAIILLAVYLKKYIVFLASVQLVFGILDLILYRHFIKKHISDLKIFESFTRLDFQLFKTIFKSAWPFVLLVGFSAIYNRIDVLIISGKLGYEQNGYYTAAYKFFDLLTFFPAAVSHTLLPFFSSLVANGSMVAVRQTLERYLKLMILLALPMAVGGAILAKPLVLLVNGPAFVEKSPQVLSVLVWAIALLFIYIPANALVISQLTKKAAVITGLNVLINITGNLLLVPKYGIVSAAAMTVLSEAIQAGFYFYFVKTNITNFSLLKILLKPLLASIIMGFIIWQFKGDGLTFGLVIGAFSYFVLLIIFKYLNKNDILLLQRMLKPQSDSVTV